MKLLLIFLAAAYAAPGSRENRAGYGASLAPSVDSQGEYGASQALAYSGDKQNLASDEYIYKTPIGYDQPGFDRYSDGYGNPDFVGYGGLIEQPVKINVGRQGIGFDKRTAFAYGFRMPLTYDIIRILRRYPQKGIQTVKSSSNDH